MVSLQWPVKLKKKTESMSQNLEQQTKIEAGFTQIKGTQFLMKRIEFTEDFFGTMCKIVSDQIQTLISKIRSPQEEQLLELRTMQLMNLEGFRMLKKSAMAWSIAREDNDMSERYSALEKVFSRNWDNPKHQKLLMACLWYMGDISFGEKHVEPAPTLLVQQPVGGQRISLDGFGFEGKEKDTPKT